MDLGDLTQLTLLAATVLVMVRVGWAVARLLERRFAARPALPDDTAERLRVLEEEQVTLRQELAELQERQDFTERALVRDGSRVRPAPGPLPDRVVTPH